MKSKLTAFFTMLVFTLLAPVVQPLLPAATEGTPHKGWEKQWKELLNEAAREGNIVILSAASSEARIEMSRTFKEKTGLTLGWIAGRPAELVEKLRRERQNGIYSTDVYWGSSGPAINLWKPSGMLAPLSSLLLLPEVVDPQVWYGGKLRFLDRFSYTSSLFPQPPLLINTALVKHDEIKSYKDLLRPKWRGKIVINDPLVEGTGQNWFHTNVQKILDPNFMRELAKQEPIFGRDHRLMIEGVARGKYAVLIGPQMTVAADFIRISAPIGYLTTEEGTYLTGSMGVTAVFDKAPHPKAAQVFVNWFLSKEGQTLNSKLNMTDSARLDIKTDFLPPENRRQRGVKYFDGENEEFISARPQSVELAREIFGHLMK